MSYLGRKKEDDSSVVADLADENAHANYVSEAEGDSSDFRDIDPHSGVKRGLKTRHLSMMALAGIIGPGLLVGAGGALSTGGPASLLIGFGVVGIIAFSIMQSLGELTTLYPSGGAFTALADRFVDKAFGVAVGWNYYIIWFAVLANEYNVISSIVYFWSDKVPVWGYFLIFWVSRATTPSSAGAKKGDVGKTLGLTCETRRSPFWASSFSASRLSAKQSSGSHY